ncbi:Hsp70 family protein [Actinoplanes sp. NPDC051633]|uniref:Hsp70 family protein n=1 Tax=Actinoplanes sp. NPDC051633 TaxID=3155670 RepID=UPI00342E8F7D
MQPDQPRLAIDYGTACTQAVLAWPGGHWEPLPLDGGLVLSSAVHLAATGDISTGDAAWRQAAAVPDGFVPSPLAALAGDGTGTVHVHGDDVPVADLAAATLTQVATAAAGRAGLVPDDVRLVVPAGWGPRRRTWLRQVAHRAGLGQPQLVEAPVAAATRLLAGGAQWPVGAFLLFIDLGAGCETTVLRRGPTGFEVLATMTDGQAGGTALDDHITAALTAGIALGTGQQWEVRASLRAAREQLSQQTVVSVPMPVPQPPLVVHNRIVEDHAEPVYQAAADLAEKTVAAAELTTGQLAGVYLIGAASAAPAASSVIGTRLGVPVISITEPGFAAVLGAADAGSTVAAGDTPAAAQAPPPLRRLWGILIPGLASLVLYAHMVFSATFHNGNPRIRVGYGYYVIAAWGELGTASLFALLAALAAAPMLGLAATRTRTLAAPAQPSNDPSAGIVVAILCGLAAAALYGVAAAFYFALPPGELLRWALLPMLPAAVACAVIAWYLRRRPAPARGDMLLGFPNASVLFAAAGMLVLSVWWQGPIPLIPHSLREVTARLAASLIGVAVGITLTRHPLARAALCVFFGLFAFFIVGRGAITALAITYAIAVALWWTQRLWIMTRHIGGSLVPAAGAPAAVPPGPR